MTRDLTSDPDREERLNEALLAYVEARQAGREPDRGQFLASHPDLRVELEEFFAGHDEMARLSAPLREPTNEDLNVTIANEDQAARSNARTWSIGRIPTFTRGRTRRNGRCLRGRTSHTPATRRVEGVAFCRRH